MAPGTADLYRFLALAGVGGLGLMLGEITRQVRGIRNDGDWGSSSRQWQQRNSTRKKGTVLDLVYVVVTVGSFGVLTLIVKGIERL